MSIELFNGLKASAWKQTIESSCHQSGSKIFDLGIPPAGESEPGFLKSIEAAHKHALTILDKTPESIPTTKTLCDIHALAAKHKPSYNPGQIRPYNHVPKVDTSSIAALKYNLKPEDLDCKDRAELNTLIKFYEYFKLYYPGPTNDLIGKCESVPKFKFLARINNLFDRNNALAKNPTLPKDIKIYSIHPDGIDRLDKKKVPKQLAKIIKIEKNVLKLISDQFQNLNHKISKIVPITQDYKYQVKSLAELANSPEIYSRFGSPYGSLQMINFEKNGDLVLLLDNLFKKYQTKIARIKDTAIDAAHTSKKLLREICDLGQTMNALHPFTDANSRSITIVQNMLLAREGAWLRERFPNLKPKYQLNPVIPVFGYYAPFTLKDRYIKLIKEGMADWRKEKMKLDHASSKTWCSSSNKVLIAIAALVGFVFTTTEYLKKYAHLS